MLERLKNLIKLVRITGSEDSDQDYPVQQIDYHGRPAEAACVYPYGFHADIAKDVLGICVNINSDNANKAIVGCIPPDRPALESGEVSIYHPGSGSKIVMKSNGSIEISTGSKELKITTSKLNVTGDLDISGDVALAGDLGVTGDTTLGTTVTSGGKDISGTHTHVGSPTAGTGPISPTGVPV